MRNRIVLVLLVVGVWMALKAIDKFFTGPEVLFILCGVLSMMIAHTIWLFSAQQRHHKKVLARRSLGLTSP